MRLIGSSLAGLFTAISSGWFIFLLPTDLASSDRAVWLGGAALSAVLGWVGVYGWMVGRPVLMVLGAWGVIWGNLVLWSAVVAPIAFAVVTTVLAVFRMRDAVATRRLAGITR